MIDHWQCISCGMLFSDEQGTKEISNIAIPATGHNFILTHTDEPDCTHEGTNYYSCDKCTADDTQSIAATGHSFSDDYSLDGENHWHDCIACDERNDVQKHTAQSGECTTCRLTTKLVFQLNGETYSLKNAYSLQDTITIPSTYNNLPVTRIDDFAFNACKTVQTVTIPNSVTYISEGAFKDCTALRDVTMSSNAEIIGGFENCTSLTSINIGNSVISLPPRAFYGCTALESIVIPKTLSTCDVSAFENCTALKEVFYAGLRANWEHFL